MENERTENMFYLDLKHVHKYGCAKFQPNPFFSSQQTATERPTAAAAQLMVCLPYQATVTPSRRRWHTSWLVCQARLVTQTLARQWWHNFWLVCQASYIHLDCCSASAGLLLCLLCYGCLPGQATMTLSGRTSGWSSRPD